MLNRRCRLQSSHPTNNNKEPIYLARFGNELNKQVKRNLWIGIGRNKDKDYLVRNLWYTLHRYYCTQGDNSHTEWYDNFELTKDSYELTTLPIQFRSQHANLSHHHLVLFFSHFNYFFPLIIYDYYSLSHSVFVLVLGTKVLYHAAIAIWQRTNRFSDKHWI